MMFADSATLPRRLFRTLLGLLISPFGYAKELVLCAVLIGLTIWSISWCHDWWMMETPDAANAAAALAHPSISRLKAASNGDGMLLFRDFREILAVNDAGEERFHSELNSPECLQFGHGEFGWSYVFLDQQRRICWQHETLGEFFSPSELPVGSMHDISLSGDGLTVAALYPDQELRIWRRQDDGTVACQTLPLTRKIDKVYLSPRGRRLAVKTADQVIEWMDPQTGEMHGQAVHSPMLPVCNSWSHDEQWFAIGTEYSQIHVWRTDGTTSPAFTIPDVGILFSVAMSADGRWLVAGLATGDLTAWHDGRQVWSKSAHEAGIRGLDLTADGKSVITGCVHGGLKIHTLETGEFVRELSNER